MERKSRVFCHIFTLCRVDIRRRHISDLYPDPDRENHLLDKTIDSYLDFTARKENGVFTFDADGIKGHLEFSQMSLWLVIEESTDKRFPVGYHRLGEYTPEDSDY